MSRLLKSIAVLTVLFYSAANAQQPSPTPAGKEPVKKTNARPSPTPPRALSEPYDKADVKTMGALCVILDTEAGIIVLEMYPELAPETVRNFLNMAAIGALDNTTFSRVVPAFVVQGGDLYTNEKITTPFKWRALRKIKDEPNKIMHEKGILSMARPAEPDSASTHFFILLKSSPTLDGTFAAFGRVIKGMEVVEAIGKMPVVQEKPDKPVRIRKATVGECPVPVPAPAN
jgi:peptidyl-prolyl cis-trans isomerase B (cyclophilin B)